VTAGAALLHARSATAAPERDLTNGKEGDVRAMAKNAEGRRARLYLAAVTVAVLALVAAACGGSSKSSTTSTSSGATGTSAAPKAVQDGGKLTVGIGSEPENLDPDKIRAGTDLYTALNVFEQLLGRDPDGKLVPGLAESWEMTPDGLHYTFKLRKGVTFQNGDPMTADDVKFSFERYVDPALGNVFAYQLSAMQSVEVVAPDQVRINLKQPDGAFLPAAGYAFIVPQKLIQQVGNDAFAQNPVGTGPWKFKSRVIKQSLTFQRHDGYWGDKPGYSEFEYRILSDDNARVSALRSGEVDVIAQVPPQNVSQLKSDKSLKVAEAVTGDNIFVIFNTLDASKPLANPQVRKALAMAVDQKAIQDKVLGNLGILMSGVSPLIDGWDPKAVKQEPYDPAAAKKMLADAGFAQGFEMDFVAPVNGRLPNSEQVTQAIAGFWQNIGIKVNTKVLAYSQWVDIEKAGSQLNGAVFGLYGDSTTFDPQARLVGTMTCKGPYSHVCDPQLDQMIDGVKTTVNHDARVQAYKNVFAYISDKIPAMWLYTSQNAFAMKTSVDWKPWHGIPYTRMGNAKHSS
jgi:peptide/nickel transport system substrate-binding protein